MLELLIIGCALCGGDFESWPWSMSTSGEDAYWESPGLIRTDAESYYVEQIAETAFVTIEYLGIEFGPVDASDQIPTEYYNAIVDGPCPTTFATAWFVTPEPPAAVTISFDTTTDLYEDGLCSVLIHNITLGTADYDLGWPFGTVTVNLTHLEYEGVVNMTASGASCVGDLDGSGDVGANDLLAILADWGDCGDTCTGDANGDGIADVEDLLLVIGAFGACL
jgi:hypothetical protein